MQGERVLVLCVLFDVRYCRGDSDECVFYVFCDLECAHEPGALLALCLGMGVFSMA